MNRVHIRTAQYEPALCGVKSPKRWMTMKHIVKYPMYTCLACQESDKYGTWLLAHLDDKPTQYPIPSSTTTGYGDE